jgi:hypothetical protein
VKKRLFGIKSECTERRNINSAIKKEAVYSASTDNKIEWYVKNTAINEVIFEGNTYESCVNFLETLINKLVETGKYKYLE